MATAKNELLEARCPGGELNGRVAAGKRLFANTICFFDAGGYLTDTAGTPFAGIIKDEANNTDGADGDISQELYTEGVIYLEGAGFTQATVGQAIHATDNYTVATAGGSKIGRCVEFVSATKIGVKIDVVQA